jgi:hypothetical protein
MKYNIFYSLDGLTAVVEEMDFREHEDDFRQPGNHFI